MKQLLNIFADLIGAMLLIGGFFFLYYILVPTY